MGRAQVLRPRKQGNQGGDDFFFELLDVAVLDLPHEGCALEKVALEIGGKLAGTTKNWLWSTSEKETGPRAGMRWAPHWKMRPAFHATRRKMSAAAAAKARRGERKSWANLWSKSARPKMKMGVNEMK